MAPIGSAFSVTRHASRGSASSHCRTDQRCGPRFALTRCRIISGKRSTTVKAHDLPAPRPRLARLIDLDQISACTCDWSSPASCSDGTLLITSDALAWHRSANTACGSADLRPLIVGQEARSLHALAFEQAQFAAFARALLIAVGRFPRRIRPSQRPAGRL